MALSPRLHLRQAQSLVITPQLLQSIRLLQFTHTELEQFIAEAVERNPLLEMQAGEGSDSGDAPAEVEHGIGADAEESTNAASDDGAGMPYSAEAIAEQFDSSLENLFPDDPGVQETISPDLSAQWRSATASDGIRTGRDGFDLEATAAASPTLREHVREQIALVFRKPQDRLLACALAEELDEAGYFVADLEEIAAQLGVSSEALGRVLAVCQTLDPAGLFARNLAECLGLQLAARDRLDPAMQKLLGHLDLLARRDFRELAKICGVDEEDLIAMLAEIRTLDPKPGTAFTMSPAEPIVADVLVGQSSDGGWTVELNPEALPRVLVNEGYFAMISPKLGREDKKFLSDCLQNANWLVRSLDQRARTILKVSTEIIRQQDGFLLYGVHHLRPLKLRDVAEAIGMHESTISRVVANKYMMTPRGIFELRYFFTSSIASADGGEARSAEAVRERIRLLIEEETADSVLSDDTIVDVLRKEGIEIARRTVAKYREAMNIPSSVQRRREKKAFAKASA